MELDEWIEKVNTREIEPDPGEMVQLYWKDGRWHIRKVARTITEPTDAQQDHREAFAQIMEGVRGSRMKDGDTLPPGAKKIRKAFKGTGKRQPRLRGVDRVIQDYLRQQRISTTVQQILDSLEGLND
jgi:hypothetical protein